MALQHLRSSTASKRPLPEGMSDGQLAINTNLNSPGVFFKDSNGDLVKVGPVHVGATAPNSSPATGGEEGNTKGEQWLDTSGTNPVLKIWDGSTWQSEAGEFVNVSGDTMTGALGIIAGSAASPSLFISGDANTGIYSPGEDTLSVSVSGTERFRFDPAPGLIYAGNGNRNATPVDSTIAATGAIGTSLAGASLTLQGGRSTGSGLGGPVIISTSPAGADGTALNAAQERLRIDSSGRLLVGTSDAITTAASSLFQVNDAAGARVVLGRTDTTVVAGNRIGEVRFFSNGGDGNYGECSAILCEATDADHTTTSKPSALVLKTTPVDTTTAEERLRITSDGKLGLGTIDPQQLLHVTAAGTNPAYLRVDASGSNATNAILGGIEQFNRDSSNAGPTVVGRVQFRSASDSSGAGGQIFFQTHDSSGSEGSEPTTRMIIDEDGNVGIGTDAPDNSLHVVGLDGAVPSFPTTGTRDIVVIENDQNCNINLIAGSGSTSDLKFTVDAASGSAGSIGYEHSTSGLVFKNDGEKARIDSSGRLLVGTSSAVGNGLIQVEATGDSLAHIRRNTTSLTSGPALQLRRSYGTSLNTFTAVPADGNCGYVQFFGSDGSADAIVAQISAAADGQTLASGDNPGRLVFSTTADGASSPTTRLVIKSTGSIDHNMGSGLVYTNYQGDVTDNGASGTAQFTVTIVFPDTQNYFICEILGYHRFYTATNEYYRLIGSKRVNNNTNEVDILEDLTSTGSVTVGDNTITFTGRRPRSNTSTSLNSRIQVLLRSEQEPTSVTIADI